MTDQNRSLQNTAEAASVPSQHRRSRKTFATFVVTEENRLAHAAALAVAEQPGEAYNPLVIYGPNAVGKIHLLRAIAHHVETHHPRLRASRLDYIPASSTPNRIVLQRPPDGDLLVITERAGGSHRDRPPSGLGLLSDRRQQIVLSCRSYAQATAMIEAAGLTQHSLIAEIAQTADPHSEAARHQRPGPGWLRPQLLRVETASIDHAGRLCLPVSMRTRFELTGNVTLTAGAASLSDIRRPPACVDIWSAEQYERYMTAVLGDPTMLNRLQRELSRLMRVHAHPEQLTDDGLISIPRGLRDYARLEREAAILEFDDRLQIWPSQLDWRSCYGPPRQAS